MFTAKEIVFLKAITPMHVGSGSDLGIVDLPVQRERHTQYPKIEASGLKGVLRELAESLENLPENEKNKLLQNLTLLKNNDADKSVLYNETVESVFGPAQAEQNPVAGALALTDARILLFPVKSVRGVFAWITCPEVIKRFYEDMRLIDSNINLEEPNLKSNEIIVSPNSSLLMSDNKTVILEEYTFKAKKTDDYFEWYKNLPKDLSIDKNRMAIVSDDMFRDFVEMSTEVITRIKIGNNGTVKKSGLWTEEYLPAETVLYSIMMARKPFNTNAEAQDVINFVKDLITQVGKNTVFIGGNTTIGKGLTQIIIQNQ